MRPPWKKARLLCSKNDGMPPHVSLTREPQDHSSKMQQSGNASSNTICIIRKIFNVFKKSIMIIYSIIILYHTERAKCDIFPEIFAQRSQRLNPDRLLLGY